MNGMDELLLFLGSNPDEVMMMSCYRQLFPVPRPASRRLHLCLTVLQATGNWARAWERLRLRRKRHIVMYVMMSHTHSNLCFGFI